MNSKLLNAILILFVLTIRIYAGVKENRIISGNVTAFKSFPLNNVLIKSSITGTIEHSDSLGHFIINCADNDILIFSASGFDVKRVKIRKLQNLSIDLVYSNKETSFEDAVKNNHIPEEDLQKGINRNRLKEEKDYSKYINIYELIDNEILNVKVIGNSVLTTKVLSLSLSPQVLYVVDEMIVTDISFINPFEVKSLQYIDGVGASLYGSKGANGIIKITLKK